MTAKDNIEFIFVKCGIEIRLKSASTSDLHSLRIWKNENREYFFHKDPISPVQQKAWFDSYLSRPYDFMFVVRVNENSVGCMGIRLCDNIWDVYNVILGEKAYGKHGVMSAAFRKMLAYAQTLNPCPITLKVLKDNPAVVWYKKQGFVVVAEYDGYLSMNYQRKRSNMEGSL